MEVNVLENKIDNIAEDVREVRDDVKEVKVEARLTNGRVRSLELWQAKMEGLGIGAKFIWPAISGIAGAVVIGALFYTFGPEPMVEQTQKNAQGKTSTRQHPQKQSGTHSGPAVAQVYRPGAAGSGLVPVFAPPSSSSPGTSSPGGSGNVGGSNPKSPKSPGSSPSSPQPSPSPSPSPAPEGQTPGKGADPTPPGQQDGTGKPLDVGGTVSGTVSPILNGADEAIKGVGQGLDNATSGLKEGLGSGS